MPEWTSSVVDAISTQFKVHPYWGPRFANFLQTNKFLIHLAVFVEPFLQFVVEGTKTVESRFSVNRCAPYGAVRAGDLLLMKRSAGPIVAVAEVTQVWYYELDSDAWDTIRTRFGPSLQIKDPAFWERRRPSCFATLMGLGHVESISPISCAKRDRRGWVVLDRIERQRSLFENDEIPAAAILSNAPTSSS
jgi:hypothetical protein